MTGYRKARVGRAFVFFDIEQEGEKDMVAAWRFDWPDELVTTAHLDGPLYDRTGRLIVGAARRTLSVTGPARGFVMVKPDWWEAQPRDLGLAARTPPLPPPRGEIG